MQLGGAAVLKEPFSCRNTRRAASGSSSLNPIGASRFGFHFFRTTVFLLVPLFPHLRGSGHHHEEQREHTGTAYGRQQQRRLPRHLKQQLSRQVPREHHGADQRLAHTEGHQGGQALKAGAARHHHIDERLEEQRAALNERPSDRHRRRTEHQNGHKTHDAEGDGDAIQLRYGEGRPLSRQGTSAMVAMQAQRAMPPG